MTTCYCPSPLSCFSCTSLPLPFFHGVLTACIQYWFHIFAPHRLEIDATQNHSTSTVDWTETGQTEGGVLNVVDVSKILHCRPLRDRR